jgi:hypothetical protein
MFTATDNLLSDFEHCNRHGYWSRSWRRAKMTPSEMMHKAISVGLASDRKDFSQHAGEQCYEYGAEPGLISKQQNIHSEVVHLANLSDIICAAARSGGPWKPVEAVEGWSQENLFLSPDGQHLRRVALVTTWSDDRHYSLCRSWGSLGPICHFVIPMQLVVVVLGQHRNGKHHSFWSHGLRHPVNKKLRFRKKKDIATGFKSSWIECWREDFDEISTAEWLTAMMEDDVLRDLLFKIDIPVPEKNARQKIVDLAERRLDKLWSMKALPDQQLSTCDWPTPCDFRSNCHANQEPSSRFGFVSVDSLSR